MGHYPKLVDGKWLHPFFCTRTAREKGRDSSNVDITLVHGTFSSPGVWGSTVPLLEQGLRDAGLNPTFHYFSWSGENTHCARISAAKGLAAYLESQYQEHATHRQFVVGHSHGGTLASYALRNSYIKEHTEGFVTLGTPLVTVGPRRIHLVYDAWKWCAILSPLMIIAGLMHPVMLPFILALLLANLALPIWMIVFSSRRSPFLAKSAFTIPSRLSAIPAYLRETYREVCYRQKRYLDYWAHRGLTIVEILQIRVLFDEAFIWLKILHAISNGAFYLLGLLLSLIFDGGLWRRISVIIMLIMCIGFPLPLLAILLTTFILLGLCFGSVVAISNTKFAFGEDDLLGGLTCMTHVSGDGAHHYFRQREWVSSFSNKKTLRHSLFFGNEKVAEMIVRWIVDPEGRKIWTPYSRHHILVRLARSLAKYAALGLTAYLMYQFIMTAWYRV